MLPIAFAPSSSSSPLLPHRLFSLSPASSSFLSLFPSFSSSFPSPSPPPSLPPSLPPLFLARPRGTPSFLVARQVLAHAGHRHRVAPARWRKEPNSAASGVPNSGASGVPGPRKPAIFCICGHATSTPLLSKRTLCSAPRSPPEETTSFLITAFAGLPDYRFVAIDRRTDTFILISRVRWRAICEFYRPPPDHPTYQNESSRPTVVRFPKGPPPDINQKGAFPARLAEQVTETTGKNTRFCPNWPT